MTFCANLSGLRGVFFPGSGDSKKSACFWSYEAEKKVPRYLFLTVTILYYDLLDRSDLHMSIVWFEDYYVAIFHRYRRSSFSCNIKIKINPD